MVDSLRAAAGRPPVPVVVNPEFTREGSAVMDYLEPDRIVIGVISDDTGAGVRQLRRMYHSVTAPFLVMASEDAVLAKLGANLFLATKISFANELAMLCEAYNADVTQVVEAMSHDARIGGAFLRAGIGFGGSCLPHQVTMTVHAAEAAGRSTPLLAAVDQINHQRRFDFVARLEAAVGGIARGRPGRASRPDLQARHGRPARGAVADHRGGGHRGRRRGDRVRPDGVGSQSCGTADPGPADRRVRGGGPRGRRRGRSGHRVVRVHPARLGSPPGHDAPTGHRRRTQCPRSRGHGRGRLPAHRLRSARRGRRPGPGRRWQRGRVAVRA